MLRGPLALTNIAFWLPNSLRYMAGGIKWALQAVSLLQERGHYVEVFAPPFSLHKSITEVETSALADLMYRETWTPDLAGFESAYMIYSPLWRLCRVNCGKTTAGLHSPLWYSDMTDLVFSPNLDSAVYLMGKSYYSLFGAPDLALFRRTHIINPVAKVNRGNVVFVPNWVDTGFWKPKEAKEQTFSVLFVGRRNLEKGWDIYTKVVDKMQQSNLDIDFYAVGSKYGLIKGVKIESETEMPSLYSRFHVVVTPARLNAFPLTFLESLACGTPVITLPRLAHIGLYNLGMPLLFGNTTTEIMQRIFNVYSTWMKSPKDYNNLCVNARNAMQKFDVDHVFPSFEKMLTEI